MSRSKPRTEVSPLPPQPKTVPYPPPAIWKGKEDGVEFEFRGNKFVRLGARISRVFETPTVEAAETPGATRR